MRLYLLIPDLCEIYCPNWCAGSLFVHNCFAWSTALQHEQGHYQCASARACEKCEKVTSAANKQRGNQSSNSARAPFTVLSTVSTFGTLQGELYVPERRTPIPDFETPSPSFCDLLCLCLSVCVSLCLCLSLSFSLSQRTHTHTHTQTRLHIYKDTHTTHTDTRTPLPAPHTHTYTPSLPPPLHTHTRANASDERQWNQTRQWRTCTFHRCSFLDVHPQYNAGPCRYRGRKASCMSERRTPIRDLSLSLAGPRYRGSKKSCTSEHRTPIRDTLSLSLHLCPPPPPPRFLSARMHTYTHMRTRAHSFTDLPKNTDPPPPPPPPPTHPPTHTQIHTAAPVRACYVCSQSDLERGPLFSPSSTER